MLACIHSREHATGPACAAGQSCRSGGSWPACSCTTHHLAVLVVNAQASLARGHLASSAPPCLPWPPPRPASPADAGRDRPAVQGARRLQRARPGAGLPAPGPDCQDPAGWRSSGRHQGPGEEESLPPFPPFKTTLACLRVLRRALGRGGTLASCTAGWLPLLAATGWLHTLPPPLPADSPHGTCAPIAQVVPHVTKAAAAVVPGN